MATDQERLRMLELELELENYSTAEPQAPPQAAPELPAEAWYEDLAEGVGLSGLETYYGVKDLLGYGSAEDRETLKAWREDAAQSAWGTAGQVLGEIGQMAIPGGAALKGARALSKTGRLFKGVPTALDAAVAGGHGYIAAPEEGESRLANAMQNVGGSLAGGLIGRGISKLGRGLEKTPEAQKLLDEGIELTPGQATKSMFPRALETVMGITPSLATGVKELQGRALSQWNKKLLNEVAPPGSTIENVGTQGFKELKSSFDNAYNKAWGKAKEPSDASLFSIVRSAKKDASELGRESRAQLNNAVNDIIDLSTAYSPKKLKELDNSLRKSIDSAYNANPPQFALGKSFEDMRSKLRESVGKETTDALSEIDPQYRKYQTAIRASERRAEEGVEKAIRPRDVLAASKVKGRPGQFSRGESPLVDIAEPALQTVGWTEKAPLINIMKAVSRNVASPTPVMSGLGRLGLGETALQKGAIRFGSPLAEALRERGITSRIVGGALLGE